MLTSTILMVTNQRSSCTIRFQPTRIWEKSFQDIQNYRISVFYYVKMLQTAWLLNNREKELEAYDFLGIQYYYLGELANAQYYHNKLRIGRNEDSESDLRRLGIEKIIAKIHEKQRHKNFFRSDGIKTIEQELTSSSNPASEDEFELPEPLKHHIGENSDSARKELSTWKSRRVFPVFKKYSHSQGNPNLQPKLHSRSHYDPSKMQKATESYSYPPKPILFLSHFSPNRFLQNFQNTDTKDIVNNYVHTKNCSESKAKMFILDKRSSDRVKKKLESFLNVIKLAELEINSLITQHILT